MRKKHGMNNKRLPGIIGCVTAIILMAGAATSCGDLPRPMIDYVPINWGLSGLTPYEEGLYVGEYDDQSGLIEYTNEVTHDLIYIFYERAPKWDWTPIALEQDADAIFQRDLGYMADETGTTTIAGTTAGYARGYDSDYDVYDLELVLVLNRLYLDVYASYAMPEAEDQILAMIDSISV
jgi:hypothetical protein